MKTIKGIFVEAGHGMQGGVFDPGAIGTFTTERKEVVEIAKETVELLKNQQDLRSVHVFDIGVQNNLDLSGKIAQIEDISRRYELTTDNSILISIHVNAGGGTGVESWYYTGEEGRKLGNHIGAEMGHFTKLIYRGVKMDVFNRWGSLRILRETTPLAILVECGFIDTVRDHKILTDPTLDDNFAKGIVKGIMEYLGLRFSELKYDMPTGDGFTDVKGDEWFASYIYAAMREGLMTGYPDNTFRPAQNLTRAELAKVISLLLEKIKKDE